MPPGIWQTEFLNANENRAYPLFEGATKTDKTGAFVLPDSFLCACYIAVHAALDVDPAKFFLQEVTVDSGGYGLVFGYDDGSAYPPAACKAAITRASHTEYDAYTMAGVGDFTDTQAHVVIGRLDEIDQQPPGQFFFDPAGGLLDTDCIRPIIRGLGSIAVVNGQDVSDAYDGDIQLMAGTNIAISVVMPGVFRIDAVEGAGLTSSCSCTGTGTLPPPIRSINGVPPRADGSFDMLGDRCISIGTQAGGLTFTDACSQPCCGCSELEALTAELAHLGAEAAAYKSLIAQLQAELNQFNAVVLGSRINDAPCVVCP